MINSSRFTLSPELADDIDSGRPFLSCEAVLSGMLSCLILLLVYSIKVCLRASACLRVCVCVCVSAYVPWGLERIQAGKIAGMKESKGDKEAYLLLSASTSIEVGLRIWVSA